MYAPSMEALMTEDEDLSYLDLIAVRALLIWPLVAWVAVFFASRDDAHLAHTACRQFSEPSAGSHDRR